MERGVEDCLDTTTSEAFSSVSMGDDWFTNLDLFPLVGRIETF